MADNKYSLLFGYYSYQIVRNRLHLVNLLPREHVM